MNTSNYATLWMEATPLPFGLIGSSRELLRSAVINFLSVIYRSSTDTFLRCLYCHNVFDDQKKDFEVLIAGLKRIGQFIDTDTCIDMLNRKKVVDGRYFHLSFDDGFRNNYTNALPILVRQEVPAIFFVPSSLMDADWVAAREYSLETTRYRSVIELLKWSDLRQMIASGFEIGSHTRTHAQFSAISEDPVLLEDEILGSKRELEKYLEVECKYISWPYGRLTDADNKSLKMVEDVGYLACFGAYRGTINPKQTDIFSIPRHHFEVHWPISHVNFFARGNMEKVVR